MINRELLQQTICLTLMVWLLIGCGGPTTPTATLEPPTTTPRPTTGAITGKVLSADGTPLVNADNDEIGIVTLVCPSDDIDIECLHEDYTNTDLSALISSICEVGNVANNCLLRSGQSATLIRADGSYTLSNVPPGQYDLVLIITYSDIAITVQLLNVEPVQAGEIIEYNFVAKSSETTDDVLTNNEPEGGNNGTQVIDPLVPTASLVVQKGNIIVVSVGQYGALSNYSSSNPAVSGDGRYVVFNSSASNLVSGDTNGANDVFVHDRDTGVTTRVSTASDGAQANGRSYSPAISGDGRYVCFISHAENLAPGDTNDEQDIYLRDINEGLTTRISIADDGTQSNDASFGCSISGDGSYITFGSGASNLVPDDTNDIGDIFVHERETGLTSRVSVSSDGAQSNNGSGSPSISRDGRYITFVSQASNLISDDTNNTGDIFVHERETGLTSRVSVSSDGAQSNGESYGSKISEDGAYIAFMSLASNLVPDDTNDARDVFVRDVNSGVTTRISVARGGTQTNNESYVCSISGDGRYVAFTSWADNLVPGDTNYSLDIFVYDRERGE